MRGSLKLLAGCFLTGALLFAAALAYTTAKGYTHWFFAVQKAQITVDGKRAEGWLHIFKGSTGTEMFLTRKGTRKSESYQIWLPTDGKGWVSDCGDWIAPRFWFFPVNHQEHPCFTIVIEEPGQLTTKPLERRLEAGANFVEFTADDGQRIRASW